MLAGPHAWAMTSKSESCANNIYSSSVNTNLQQWLLVQTLLGSQIEQKTRHNYAAQRATLVSALWFHSPSRRRIVIVEFWGFFAF